MNSKQNATRSFISTVGTAMVVRPIDILVHVGYIIAGTGTPAALRGGMATVVILTILWLASSTWSDSLAGAGARTLPTGIRHHSCHQYDLDGGQLRRDEAAGMILLFYAVAPAGLEG